MGAASSTLILNQIIESKISILRDYFLGSNVGNLDEFNALFDDKNEKKLLVILTICLRAHFDSLHIELTSGNIYRIEDSDIKRIMVIEDTPCHDDALFAKYIQQASIQPKEPVYLVAEKLNLDKVAFATNDCFKECYIHGLNLSDNQINDETITTLTHANMKYLRHLDLSSNQLSNAINISASSSVTLQVLDLSYNTNLGISFTKKCFLFLPQLKVLHLDGCNLKKTYHGDRFHPDDPSSSIFYGLCMLEELGLRDNELEDVDSVTGLDYFGCNQDIYPGLLRHIMMSDNPFHDEPKLVRDIRSHLLEKISSLTTFDSTVCRSRESRKYESFDIRKYITRADDTAEVLPNGPGVDSLEKEYLSALRGERDVTSIS